MRYLKPRSNLVCGRPWGGSVRPLLQQGVHMNTDRYTKFVLTVIAVALTTLCIQNTIQVASAESPEQVHKVAICNQAGDQCVRIVSSSKYPEVSGYALQVLTR